MGKHGWVPRLGSSLAEWCTTTHDNGSRVKDDRAIFLLVMWELWKHHNAIVFDGATLSLRVLVRRIEEEGRTWSKAGILKGEAEPLFGALARWANERS